MRKEIKFMYKIEPTTYGFKLTFAGNMSVEEMTKWLNESTLALAKAPKSFGVVIDMVNLMPLQPAVKEVLIKGQAAYKNKGMKHSSVIVPSNMIAMQMKNTATASGIIVTEKYFSNEDKTALQEAVKWASTIM